MRYTLGGASIYVRANGARAPVQSPYPVTPKYERQAPARPGGEGITSLIPATAPIASPAQAPGQQAPPPVLRIAESGTGSGSGAGYGFIPSQVETKPAQTAWLLPAALAVLYFLS